MPTMAVEGVTGVQQTQNVGWLASPAPAASVQQPNLTTVKFCADCGGRLVAGAKFCAGCGSKQEVSGVTGVQQTQNTLVMPASPAPATVGNATTPDVSTPSLAPSAARASTPMQGSLADAASTAAAHHSSSPTGPPNSLYDFEDSWPRFLMLQIQESRSAATLKEIGGEIKRVLASGVITPDEAQALRLAWSAQHASLVATAPPPGLSPHDHQQPKKISESADPEEGLLYAEELDMTVFTGLTSTSFCNVCGIQNDGSVKFCRACGAAVE